MKDEQMKSHLSVNTFMRTRRQSCTLLLRFAAVFALGAFAAGPAQAGLVHRWTFNDGTANDSVGTANGTLYGTATIIDGRLELSGSSGDNRMEATLGAPLGVNKTLVAWFTLSSLTPDNTAGGPLGVEDAAESVFDAITYGEAFGGQWMNGSDNWSRTFIGDNGGAIETLVETNEIMMAITQDSGAANQIKLYRNGVLYAQYSKGTLRSYLADGKVVIGPRVGTAGYIDGYINEARIYDTALTADQIAALSLSIPLVFAQEPQNLMAYAGETQSLIARAIGDEPIGYQWYKNGGPLAGATSTNLNFPSLQASNAGSYVLVASNASLMITSQVARVVVRTPADGGLFARWTFDDGTARDVYGFMDGTLYGTATITNGRLQLSGSSGANRMETTLGAPLGVNKTLVAWFTLSSLTPNNTAGGPLGVEDLVASAFDSITYGEAFGGQWMNGSDNWARTFAGDNGGAIETLVEPNEIIMAITQDSGAANQIKLYRNGAFYAQYSKGTLRSYLAGCKAVIGPRFGQDGYMNGYVNEARLYDRALSTAEIAALAGLTLFISSQPQNQMVLVGQTATFAVGAGGGAPYSFQWLKDGAPIGSQTATNLVLTNVQLAAAGGYAVVVSNPSGSVTSAVARLEVSNVSQPATNDLALWLDATDMDGNGQPDSTADGTAVTLWTDKSGMGNDATATGNLTYAPGGLNGRPAVTCDGSAFFRTVSGGEGLHDAFTMFVVFKNVGGARLDTALEWGNEDVGQRRGMLRFPSGVFTFNGYGADVNSSAQVTANQNYLGVITKATALDGILTLYLNGTRVAAGSPSGGLSDFASAAITVGANNDGGEQWNGHIAEVLIYNRELSAQELNQMGLYLRFKYGMAANYSNLALVQQPQGQSSLVGGNVTLTAQAVGLTPLNYQWYRNGSAVNGATDPTLSLTNIQLSASGDYIFVANNPAGSVTSVVAHVAVSLPRTPVTSDLTLWLDATDMDDDGHPDTTADGTVVTLWTDKSGHRNNATATGNLTYAPAGLNGSPAVTFDGGSFFRTVSGGESLHDGFTMFVVFENDGLAQVDTALEWGNEDVGQRRGMLRFPNGVFAFNGYGADLNSSTQVTANQNYIGVITKPTALNGILTLYLNGTQVAAGTAPLTNFTSAAITVGANNDPDNSEWWTGHIAEVLIYSRKLSDQELNETGLYLGFKYGIASTYVLPPTLTIVRTGTNAAISWPAPGPGWVLESTDAVPGGFWKAVPGVVNNSVTVPSAAAAQFYRLRHQP